MFVFRFEDSEGKGPFTWNKPEEMQEAWYDIESETEWNPFWGPAGTSDHNMGWEEIREFIFGCPCVEEFDYWFPPTWQKFLEGWGFQIKAFELHPEDVFMSSSGSQCLFRRESAISETIL